MNALAETGRPLNRALSSTGGRDKNPIPIAPFQGAENFSRAIHRPESLRNSGSARIATHHLGGRQ